MAANAASKLPHHIIFARSCGGNHHDPLATRVAKAMVVRENEPAGSVSSK